NMRSAADSLLGEIESHCRRSGMAESTFGRLAVNDGKLCSRLRSGKDVTLETAERIRSFISENRSAHGSGSEQAVPVAEKDNTMSDKTSTRKKTSARTQTKRTTPSTGAGGLADDRPFRFYDNRQKYLAFV